MKSYRPSPLVWVTGASSGLGRALARLYASDGATVLASARSVDKLQALAAEFPPTISAQRTARRDQSPADNPVTGCIVPLPMDVTDQNSVADGSRLMLSEYGTPDVIVLNAGYYEPCSLKDITFDHFEKTVDVNYRGVVRCLLSVLPALLDQNTAGLNLTANAASGKTTIDENPDLPTIRPHIVFVSSVAGYSGLPRAAAYGSTKAAITHLAESIRLECNANAIDVTVVNPGFVKTPLTDLNDFKMPFIMEVGDAAAAMYRGLETRRFEVTFPRRFTWMLKFLRLLPYPVYFWLTKGLV